MEEAERGLCIAITAFASVASADGDDVNDDDDTLLIYSN